MAKVYFDKEKYGIWVVEDLEDYYEFKAVDFKTNEESKHILSWSRNYDLSEMNNNIDRVYDVEIDEKKLSYAEIIRVLYGKNPKEFLFTKGGLQTWKI